MKHPVTIIVLLLLLLKLCYLGMTAAERQMNTSSVNTEIGLVEASFAINDAGWYLKIARDGYKKHSPEDHLGCCEPDCMYQSPYAFFPLFPGLIGSASRITGMHTLQMAIILSTLFSLLAFLTFFRFANDWLADRKKALLATIILILMPFHYFFGMVYTESLFLLLLILCFRGIQLKRYRMCALAFALLVICRPSGMLMGLPLLIYLAETTRNDQSKLQHAVLDIAFWRKMWIWIPAVLVLILYCYFLYIQTGDALAFKTAQAGWCKKFMFPLLSLFRSGELYAQFNSIYTLAFLLLSIAMLKSRRIPLSFHLLVWISILLPLTGGSVVSMPRYISVIFPYFLVIAQFHWIEKYRIPIIIALFIGHLASYHYWIISPHLLGI